MLGEWILYIFQQYIYFLFHSAISFSLSRYTALDLALRWPSFWTLCRFKFNFLETYYALSFGRVLTT